jgi:hypothetical protein
VGDDFQAKFDWESGQKSEGGEGWKGRCGLRLELEACEEGEEVLRVHSR